MPKTDEELQQKKDEVLKLRDELAAEQEKQVTIAREIENDVTYNALDAEAKKLQVEIDLIKSGNTKTAAKEGAASVLDPNKYAEQVEAAKNEGLLVDSEGANAKRKEGGN